MSLLKSRIAYILSPERDLTCANPLTSLVGVVENEPAARQQHQLFYWHGEADPNITLYARSKGEELVTGVDEDTTELAIIPDDDFDAGDEVLEKILDLEVDGQHIRCSTEGPAVEIRGEWLYLHWVDLAVVPSWHKPE